MHLCEFPAPGERELELEEAMTTVREAVVVASGREREAIARLADVVRDELNVKELRFVAAADELGNYTAKPNFRTLGPRFGKDMPQVAAAFAALDPMHVAAAVRDGGRLALTVGGRSHTLEAEDVMLSLAPIEGYSLEREGSHAVALELASFELVTCAAASRPTSIATVPGV